MVIQCDSGLYYETTCRINPGEELLVWFGKEYAYNVDHTVETYLCPDTGNKIERTYACTYCCLGFSSCAYLADHRNVCLNKTNQSTCIQGNQFNIYLYFTIAGSSFQISFAVHFARFTWTNRNTWNFICIIVVRSTPGKKIAKLPVCGGRKEFL